MNEHTLEKQGSALIPAVAYGDAAGLPVETKPAKYIKNTYGRINGLLPSSDNERFHTSKAPGYWSDDTQLTMAVAKALLKADGFDMRLMAHEHITAYDATEEVTVENETLKRGWGTSSVAAMERLKSGVDPNKSGTVNGEGNGVLMKLAPLAFWQFVRKTSDDERYDQYDQLTTMTHDSDMARLTTRVHGDVLNGLLSAPFDKRKFLMELRHSVAFHEKEIGMHGELQQALRYLQKPIDKNTILKETDQRGFHAPQTLAMAYGAFLMHDGMFRGSVYEAVNLGGDADSTASIAAGMSALRTREALPLPPDYRSLDQLETLQHLSLQFAKRALRSEF